MLRFFSSLVFLFFNFTKIYAQCTATIASTNGYSVNIRILPVSVIPSSNNCPWGYNYNISLNYTVTLTGSNIPPGGLYTLQGNLVCNGSQSLFYDLPNGAGTGNYVTGTNPFISNDGGTAYLYTTHPSCNAATFSNLGCSGITIDVNGPGISNQTINCSNATFGPLPIELLYFNGLQTSSGTLLKWETETEKNNDFFTIEKSLDGYTWKEMGEIAGAGNSLKRLTYSFTDDDAQNGINYYRLKQTDFDKNYSYSPVINVLNATGNITFGRLWPNPFTRDYSIEIMSPLNTDGKYAILNDLGHVVKYGNFELFTGKNEINISGEDYPAGVYVFEIVITEHIKTYRKIVKL